MEGIALLGWQTHKATMGTGATNGEAWEAAAKAIIDKAVADLKAEISTLRLRAETAEKDAAKAYAEGQRAMREEAAAICKEKAEGIREANTFRGRISTHTLQTVDWIDGCAVSIEALHIKERP